jgi:hypothetical protein
MLLFGTPEEIIKSERTQGTHAYQLLKNESKSLSGAQLYATYHSNKVESTGITHRCVVQCMVRTGAPLPPERIRQIEAENVRILSDLIEIQKKYREKLAEASWAQND